MYVEEKSALHDQWIRVRIDKVILSKLLPEKIRERFCEANLNNKCGILKFYDFSQYKKTKFGGNDECINGKKY